MRSEMERKTDGPSFPRRRRTLRYRHIISPGSAVRPVGRSPRFSPSQSLVRFQTHDKKLTFFPPAGGPRGNGENKAHEGSASAVAIMCLWIRTPFTVGPPSWIAVISL